MWRKLLIVWVLGVAVCVGAQAGVLPKDSDQQYELLFWDSIKDSTDAGDYEAYLKSYPEGRFRALATSRLQRIKASEKTQDAPSAAPAKPAPKPESKPEPKPEPKPAPKPEPKPAPKPRPAPPPREARPAPAPAPVNVSEAQDCPDCPVMVNLPAASFTMGNNAGHSSERPAHRVSIAKPYAIGKFEVTVGQWKTCVAAGGCPVVPSLANAADNTPARDVSWDDAQSYVRWLSKRTGKSYRLPTEAEWEFAARGGSTSRFWWGDSMVPGKANCSVCGEPWDQGAPAPVGSFEANGYGLHDVNGSVWEWVADCWHTNYRGAPADAGPWDSANCRVRVIRGGSWGEGADYMPVTTRFKYDAPVRYTQNGFRVARDAQ